MSSDPISILIFILILLFSMSIHEMMHAFTADWLGDDTARLKGRVSLNPIPHIDPIFTVALPLLLKISGSPVLFGAAKPVPVNFNRLRYGEFGGALVGIVGPLTNLLIACVASILFKASNPALGSYAYDAFSTAIQLNVGLFVFNSIPWPPLDGSRVLYAFAPRPLQEFMESIEHMGVASLAIFIILFYQFGGPIQDLMLKLINLLAPSLVL